MVPYGAADEARTRYLHLGKVALYQMSYSRIFRVQVAFLLCSCLEHVALTRFYDSASVTCRFDVTSPGEIAFAAAKATAVETIH